MIISAVAYCHRRKAVVSNSLLPQSKILWAHGPLSKRVLLLAALSAGGRGAFFFWSLASSTPAMAPAADAEQSTTGKLGTRCKGRYACLDAQFTLQLLLDDVVLYEFKNVKTCVSCGAFARWCAAVPRPRSRGLRNGELPNVEWLQTLTWPKKKAECFS